MAKQIQVVITDDIDGGEAHETIAFGLDGSSLEIDLNKLNAAQFRKTVAPYIEHGREFPAAASVQLVPHVTVDTHLMCGSGRSSRASRSASVDASLRRSLPTTRQPIKAQPP